MSVYALRWQDVPRVDPALPPALSVHPQLRLRMRSPPTRPRIVTPRLNIASDLVGGALEFDFDGDNEFHQMLDIACLESNMVHRRFSAELSQAPQVTYMSQESQTTNAAPYQSPAWLPCFVAYFLGKTQPRTIQMSSITLPKNTAHTPVSLMSATEYLAVHFPAEHSIFGLLCDPNQHFSRLYLHYTRYRILSRIAPAVGLDISKPRQTGEVHGIYFTHTDLFEWAQFNPGTFGNVKSIITWSEEVRQRLSVSKTLSPAQRSLLSHLQDLALEPVPNRVRRPAALG
ncbi:hypothetical protein GGX14DRAFT_399536 [Mycena pura]|uniref:Uncharacterized protein n=1 Tax=Mycena pura TaxID=153505 RepID=A0AAD6V4B6_9AGAR|nr:hypothetical protein GGX14DRAFT_399536 [Mycena pura]